MAYYFVKMLETVSNARNIQVKKKQKGPAYTGYHYIISSCNDYLSPLEQQIQEEIIAD